MSLNYVSKLRAGACILIPKSCFLKTGFKNQNAGMSEWLWFIFCLSQSKA